MISRAEKKAILRALDANCNRAREGFRVAEDVARFILNDAPLLGRIKKLRHSVSLAEQKLFKSKALRTLTEMWLVIWAAKPEKIPKKPGPVPETF